MAANTENPTKLDPREELVVHLPRLRAYAMSLTRNAAQADDLVQDTAVKAWTNLEKFQRGTNMRAWLFTILRNTHYSAGRKAGREIADVDGVHTERMSEKPAHDGRLAMRDVGIAFSKLGEEQQDALALVGGNGYSYEEAAARCGCQVGTIKSRVNRGRRRLIELLSMTGDEGFDLTDPATIAVVRQQRIHA